jgi:hypothetical protein
MLQYELIETDEGLTIAEICPGISPEEAARQQGGVVLDSGPYESYEDAYVALMALKFSDEEELD